MSRFPRELKTERLILRPLTSRDAPGLLEAVTASYPELHRWMPWAKAPYGIDDARRFCAFARRRFEEGVDFHVLLVLADDRRIIGSAGVQTRDPDVPSFEIGYWLDTAFVGRGFVTEAVRTLTHFAFDRLGGRRVELRIDDSNRRSQAVAERLGYEWEATCKSDHRDNLGAVGDTRIYAMFGASQSAPAASYPAA